MTEHANKNPRPATLDPPSAATGRTYFFRSK